MRARERQRERFQKAGERFFANAQMGTRQIRAYCETGSGCRTAAGAGDAAAGAERAVRTTDS